MDVKLPKLGEGADNGVVVGIFVKEGDTVAKGQTIMELENEKAVASIPSTADGVVEKIYVKAGDRITGVYQPATGAVFWRNGSLLGEVRDPVFARQFFGIWLSPQTSEPQLRRALLASAKTGVPVGATP